MKRLLFSLLSFATATISYAQTVTLEDFEGITPSSTTFTSNGQAFSIVSTSGTFNIFSNTTAFGWNGTAADYRFIDNSGTGDGATSVPISFSISSLDEFKVQSFWIYLAQFDLSSLGTGGTLTVTGKLDGSSQFSFTKTTGFNTSEATSKGFTLIDLSSFDGSDYSDTLIDELVISTSGTFAYAALDAFEWETTEPAPVPAITANPANTNTCIGAGASFSITASDATSYKWQFSSGFSFSDVTNGATYSGATTATLNVAGATATMNGYTYRCIASNSSGSDTSTAASLSVPTIVLGGSQVDVSCNGGSNGIALVSASGGAEPYVYGWSAGGSTAASANGLAAGFYTVTVTDNNGCSETLEFTITQPAALAAATTAVPATCYGAANGVGVVSASGGTGAISYSWSPTGGTSNFASGLYAGTYTVTITDANACQIEKTIIITEPAAITGVDVRSICVGEAYTFNGVAYASSNNTAKDTLDAANGCDSVVTLNLTVNTNGLAEESGSATSEQYSGEANVATGDCALIATVYNSNDLGTVTSDVIVGAIPGTIPFVSRYYDIKTTIAPTTPVQVTLYFTQSEIDEYNALVGIDNPDYPAIGSAGENAQITAFHSAPGSGTGIGGYDTASANVEVLPCTLSWNATDERWEATFSTTRFSGFFLHTNTDGTPLPILLKNFQAKNEGKQNNLNWSSAEEADGDIFVLERGTDGISFNKIATVKATGISGSSYNFSDVTPFNGVNFYRLLLMNNDGSQSYSKVVNATVQGNDNFVINVHPNPFAEVINIAINGRINEKASLTIIDVAGKTVSSNPVNSNNFSISLSNIAAGIYYVRYTDSQRNEIFKIVKE